ncbi:MAG: sugar transferase [Sedimentibacter sp.]|uniref:sugar transferase n=1 Tax=Sedimentibacter sp. TaxID=1960295 RepID=UPI003158E1E3
MKNNIKKDGYMFKILEELIYIACVLLGFYIAFLVRFNMNPSLFNIKPFYDNIHYIVIASVVVFYLYNIVSTVKNTLFENALIIAISLVLINMIVIAVVFFDRGFSFPRSVFLLGLPIQFVFMFIIKIFIIKYIKHYRKSKNIMIIASKKEAERIAVKLLLDKSNLDNVRYICNEINDDIYMFINSSDKIYIGDNVNNEDKLNIMKYCSIMNKDVYLIPGLFEISMVNSKTTQIDDMLVLKIDRLGLSFERRIVKRIIDIAVSLIGLILTAPVLLLVSIAIKLFDNGPIFFRQERITEGNKVFDLYKLRTMVVDAEKHSGPVLATDKDTRITPLGRFLRSSRLDEIPQLLNVLKGDMSIVGPRPERPYFVEKYNEEIEEFKYRVFVKAGITGLAQIMGKYSTDAKNKAKYDLLYIMNYSLMLDIKIIFNTVKIMFMKESSAGVADDKRLEDIIKELNLKTYEELGVTKVDNI